MEVPMLDEDEYAEAFRLYRGSFEDLKNGMSFKERHRPLFDYYKKVTGWDETVANAIMHHRIAQYGPPCEKCGKPYRTPLASFCAACGNLRESNGE